MKLIPRLIYWFYVEEGFDFCMLILYCSRIFDKA